MPIETAADVLTADVFIHAQIINIESSDIGENVVVFVLLKDTESIAQYLIFFVYSYKNGAAVITDDGCKLFICIFFCAKFKQVRAFFVMDQSDLFKIKHLF